MGTGIKIIIKRASGKSQPNASKSPNTDPEAPTVMNLFRKSTF